MSGSPDGWGNITTKLVLPDPVDPQEFVCYLVRVPKSKFHITAFLGAIFDLSYWWNWQRDDAHTATKAAQVWRKIFYSLVAQDCNAIPPVSVGVEQDDLMPLRVDCDCRVFVTCCDGTEVELITTKSPNTSQPGVGTPQPKPGGGQQTYDACINANSQWLIPFPMSSGDVASIAHATGAWNDPDHDGSVYRCSDGSILDAGTCNPDSTTVPTDPLSTATHMTMLLKVGTDYLNIGAGPVTIPPGHAGENAVLICNDSVRSNDNGTICCSVTVTNNQAGTFMHTFNFAGGMEGWTIVDDGNGTASYISGNGFRAFNPGPPPHPGNGSIVIASPVIPAHVITGMQQTVHVDTDCSPAQMFYNVVDGAHILLGANSNFGPGSFIQGTNPGSQGGVTQLFAAFPCDSNAAPNQNICSRIVVTGIGPDPF